MAKRRSRSRSRGIVTRESFVTGDRQLDRVLASLPQKEMRKAVRKATRNTIKNHVKPDYAKKIQELDFVETRATIDAAKVKATARSRVQYGSALVIDRVKVRDLRQKRGGRLGYDKKRNEPFFHPIAIEQGTKTQHAQRPLYKALMGNQTEALAQFRRELKLALREFSWRARRMWKKLT